MLKVLHDGLDRRPGLERCLLTRDGENVQSKDN